MRKAPDILGQNNKVFKKQSKNDKSTRSLGREAKDPTQELEYSILPIDINIYEQAMFIFKRSLGVLYETDYYVAKKVVPEGPNQ